jgi:hypothetical protein
MFRTFKYWINFLIHQKQSIAKQQNSIFPECSEKWIINHINYFS